MPAVLALEECPWIPVLPLIPHFAVFPASCFWQHELLDTGLGYGWVKDEKMM